MVARPIGDDQSTNCPWTPVYQKSSPMPPNPSVGDLLTLIYVDFKSTGRAERTFELIQKCGRIAGLVANPHHTMLQYPPACLHGHPIARYPDLRFRAETSP